MIRTSKQLKDKVKNISNGSSSVAQAMIRIFVMERFLERVSISEYRNSFILKGGMLVASLVGIDLRSTMDIDPYQLVKSKLLKLDSGHIRYVLECLHDNTTKIRNVKSYLLTSLYNAPSTINNYYRAEVNHDMYGTD